MPLSPVHVEEMTYNMCLNCVHIGKKCDGPNFLAMDMKQLSKWCRMRKEYLRSLDGKWTNSYISEASDIHKTSVDNFIAGKVEDIKWSTASRILKVLVNGSWGQYPCAMANPESEVIYVDNPAVTLELDITKERYAKVRQDLNITREEHRRDLSILSTMEERNTEHMRSQIIFLKDMIKTKDEMMTTQFTTIKRKNKVITILSAALTAVLISIIVALFKM